jgi:hypothetical protein
MPSRKQRRRRQKLQRHEYEYVVETEEGEIPVERLADADRGPKAKGGRRGSHPGLVDRRGRPIQKPSLARVLKRTAIFVPILIVFVVVTRHDLSDPEKVVYFLLLLALFIPFSYFVDAMVYRLILRRYEREQGEERGG